MVRAYALDRWIRASTKYLLSIAGVHVSCHLPTVKTHISGLGEKSHFRIHEEYGRGRTYSHAWVCGRVCARSLLECVPGCTCRSRMCRQDPPLLALDLSGRSRIFAPVYALVTLSWYSYVTPIYKRCPELWHPYAICISKTCVSVWGRSGDGWLGLLGVGGVSTHEGSTSSPQFLPVGFAISPLSKYLGNTCVFFLF